MEDRDWPELLSDVSVVGGAGHGAGLPRLKRGQGSRHLGVDMTFNPDNEEGTDQRNKYFTSSGNQSREAFKPAAQIRCLNVCSNKTESYWLYN